MTDEIEILSSEIRIFIAKYFDSVALLEVLLFFKNRQERAWTALEVNANLKSSPVAIEKRAKELVEKGFLEFHSSELGFQYKPITEDLRRLVETLSKLYSQYQVRIVDQIYNPNKRAMQEFAEAFKIKKDDKNG